MKRHFASTVCLAVAVLVLLPMTVQAATAVRLTKTSAREETVAASGSWLGWAADAAGAPKHFNAYLRKGSNKSVKLNAPHTQGFMGGISGTKVVYEQLTKTDANIWMYDTKTKKRTELDSNVNTKFLEYLPSIWHHLLFFGRYNPNNKESTLWLYDMDSQKLSVIADDAKVTLTPDQINGTKASGTTYLTWTKCASSCSVFEQIGTAKPSKLAQPAGKFQYSSSVSPHGTVYFARSGKGCGTGVQIVRFVKGKGEKVVFSLPNGYDLTDTYDQVTSKGNNVYFDQTKCSDATADLYKVIDNYPS